MSARPLKNPHMQIRAVLHANPLAECMEQRMGRNRLGRGDATHLHASVT